MQDRPTAPELLDAMAADLYSEVREWVPRERRFRVLVLANLCAVIARELRAGEEPSRQDLELFTALSGSSADDTREAAATLAAAIRRGELDERLPEAIGRLREHVARKLEVARPGYAVNAGDG
jgi:hypothetical protein